MKKIKPEEMIFGKIYIIKSLQFNNDSFDFASPKQDTLDDSNFSVRMISHNNKMGYIIPLEKIHIEKGFGDFFVYKFITIEGKVGYDQLVKEYYEIFEIENP